MTDNAPSDDSPASDESGVGRIVWQDLTVDDAANVRAFYEAVVGWKSVEVPVEGYCDYSMNAPGAGETVAGVCHARGSNAAIPAVWLVYITVADVLQSVAEVVRLGGTVIDGPRQMSGRLFAVIRDPAGAVCAIINAE